ncbi:hypothetical protein J22TS3_20500 [Paenibacillus sp. J22TS3]|nr:hypothetical protein J22TS3_20500 [Paenibacillus sp. J22TS3]
MAPFNGHEFSTSHRDVWPPPIHPTQKMNLFRAEKVEVQASKVILTYLYPPVNQGTRLMIPYSVVSNLR